MYARTSASRSTFAVLAGGLLIGACAHGGGAASSARMSAADMPELGEPFSALASTYRNTARDAGRLSINAPIATLCADPRAKAVLDTDLPGLTSRPEYAFFKNMSLRTLASMSRGRLTDADLAKVDAELSKINVSPELEASEQ